MAEQLEWALTRRPAGDCRLLCSFVELKRTIGFVTALMVLTVLAGEYGCARQAECVNGR